jgi:transcriptional regulator
MITEKEVAVMKLKKEGLTQQEIARRLKISQPAVSAFYNNFMKKMKEAEEIVSMAKDLGVRDE